MTTPLSDRPPTERSSPPTAARAPLRPRAEAPDAADEHPLASAIIIFFNAEKYIGEAIESVLAQSYDRWELLLVDDGSTDGSPEIARRHAREHAGRVHCLEHPGHVNRGMSASRNLGLAHARGAFVAFLDADDVWLPDKLAHQVALLRQYPGAGAVYGPSLYWYGWTGRAADLRKDHYGKTGFRGTTLVHPPELLVRSLRTNGAIMPGICSLLIRRRVLATVGQFEEAFRGTYEDQVFLSKLFARTPVLVTDRCSDRYRQHDESCCAVATRNGEYDPGLPHPARARYLEWLSGYVARERLEAPGLGAALERNLKVYRHPRWYRALARLERLARRPIRISVKIAKRTTPKRLRSWVRGCFREGYLAPPVGWVRFGSLRRLAPISRDYGYDRGQPIDRYYIERFLEREKQAIRGRVLEVGEDTYTRRFGGDRVEHGDVLHVHPDEPGVTIVADLTSAENVPSESFDCVIVTQTLQLLWDVHAAVRTIHRVLRPGGVALLTFPGLSQISSEDWGPTWYWGFTVASATRLFGEVFGAEHVQVRSWGNVLAATAFLHGLASRELRPRELEHDDPDYQLLLGVRAQKR